jgi:hypothetical protein
MENSLLAIYTHPSVFKGGWHCRFEGEFEFTVKSEWELGYTVSQDLLRTLDVS